MWGTCPLIPTKPAFSFFLSCFSSLPAKLLVSLCSLLLCRLVFQVNAGGVLCRAGGSPTCLCLTPPSSRLAFSLREAPSCVPCSPGDWAGRAVFQGTYSTLTCWSQRQEGVSPVACHPLITSSSYFRVLCSPLLEAWEGGFPWSPKSGLSGHIMVSAYRTGVGVSAAAGVRKRGG